MINDVTYSEVEAKKNATIIQKYWRNIIINEFGIIFPKNYFFGIGTFMKSGDSVDLWKKSFFRFKHLGGIYLHKKTKKREAFIHVVILQEKEYDKIKEALNKAKVNIEVTVSYSK